MPTVEGCMSRRKKSYDDYVRRTPAFVELVDRRGRQAVDIRWRPNPQA
jgi:hypothetical protein